jgi:hypothetical protein
MNFLCGLCDLCGSRQAKILFRRGAENPRPIRIASLAPGLRQGFGVAGRAGLQYALRCKRLIVFPRVASYFFLPVISAAQIVLLYFPTRYLTCTRSPSFNLSNCD